jgi:hypothetical protein
VLVWTLNAGAPLEPSADPLRMFWDGINVAWITSHFSDPWDPTAPLDPSYLVWLDHGDANSDTIPDGLPPFRTYVLDPSQYLPWLDPDVWSVQSPSPVSFYDPDTDSYSLMDWDGDGAADVEAVKRLSSHD